MRTGGGKRIGRLPKLLQGPALRLRDALPDRVRERLPPAWAYCSDGMATAHYSPFLNDQEFNRLFWAVADRWAPKPMDLRWRVWLLTECARQCEGLGAAFAEFGVYRAASAYMVLSRVSLPSSTAFHLFDTFTGIPSEGLTDSERDAGFEGSLSDTSADEVRQLLAPWREQVVLVVGDVLATVSHVETGPLAFVHLDLNAAEPTRVAMDYAYRRLASRGIMVFDDYGWTGYEDQRRAIDSFFASRPETVLALPTGQALVIKL